MSTEVKLSATVSSELATGRLDQAAVELFPEFSRARLQAWIRSGDLRVNGRVQKPHSKVVSGDQLVLDAELEPQGEWQAEDLPFPVVYEDASLLVVDKPAGLVVHPAAGNWTGTLLNGLLYRYPDLREVPRAGIVHRLDRDTTGLMVVARTLGVQANLVEQLQARTVSREYNALVCGSVISAGQVETAIGRHPAQRTKMAVVEQGGKPALTYYTPIERNAAVTHLKLSLATGRTHQIRVHMHYSGWPLLGDPVYRPSGAQRRSMKQEVHGVGERLGRQALHARRLSFLHPALGKDVSFEAALPDDFANAREALESIAGTFMSCSE